MREAQLIHANYFSGGVPLNYLQHIHIRRSIECVKFADVEATTGGVNMRKNLIYLATIVIALALPLTAGDKGDAGKGKQVFEQCAVCHNADTDEKKVGPGLKGLFQRKKLTNGKEVNDGNVLGVINTGGGGMPSFADKLSQDEKDNLVAYLHTI
jgi:cytochrome c